MDKTADSNDLKVEREKTFSEARALRERRDGRTMTDEETKEVQDLMDKTDDFTKEIDILERLEKQGALVNAPAVRKTPEPEPRRQRPSGGNGLDGRIHAAGRRMGATDADEDLRTRGWCENRMRSDADRDSLDDGGFRDIGEMLRCVFEARTKGKFDSRLEPFDSRAMQIGTGAGGGFLLAPRFQNDILEAVDRDEQWLKLRNIFNIGEGVGEVIFPRLADQDRSSDEVAGLKLVNEGEGGTITEDQPILAETRLRLGKKAALVTVSNELMNDSAIGVSRFIERTFARAVAMSQAKDCLDGSGAGSPLGVSNGGDLVTVTAGAAVDVLEVDDFATMLSKLDHGGGESTAWLIHPSVWQKLLIMTPNGASTDLAFLASDRGGASMGVPSTLLGFPIFTSDACKQLNTSGDIWLGNWSAYLYMISAMVVDVSTDSKFQTDQVQFRLKLRDAGQTWRGSTQTDRQGYETANFVRMNTRS